MTSPSQPTSQQTMPYSGEDFCITHGREHMRSQMGNPIPFCQACGNAQLTQIVCDFCERRIEESEACLDWDDSQQCKFKESY